jgi:hypothetical protein
MKHVLTLLLLLTAAFAQTDAPPAQSIPVDQQNARKARALLDQMVQALGGQAYLEIRDISREGRTYSFHLGQPNSFGIVFWQFYQYPDKDRYELTKKRDVIEIFNGDKSYEVTYKGTHGQDPKELSDYLRRKKFALDQVIREWLGAPGIALFYEGPTVAEQKSVEQVTVMNANNEGVTLYIDSSTHLPVKKTFSWRDPTDKQRNIEDEVYDNYRPIQGVMTPFSITRFYNGDMSNQRFMTAVSYNQGFNPSLFEASLPSKDQGKH